MLQQFGGSPWATGLDLSHNSLLAYDIEVLVKCNWPNLQALHLCNNRLDATAMVHLANGSWPLLRRLSLARNSLDVKALQYLIKGAWSQLERLDLSNNMTNDSWIWDTGLTGPCCDAAIAVLRGDSDVVLKEGRNWLSPTNILGSDYGPRRGS